MGDNTNQSTVEDPSNYIYVSKKHYERKLRVENDSTSLAGSITQPGPIGAFMIYLFDVVIEFFARILVYFFSFIGTGYDYVMAYTFGTFNGILPTANKNGILISYRFFRYIINIFLPPVGIFLSKGLYGWFNVIICFLLTYMHYVAGIIYCFIITANNRYADLYEKNEVDTIRKQNELYKNNGAGDLYALVGVIAILSVMIGLVALAIWHI
jgi:uncharacterized membrane protein YqaE (UPF0057 family)